MYTGVDRNGCLQIDVFPDCFPVYMGIKKDRFMTTLTTNRLSILDTFYKTDLLIWAKTIKHDGIISFRSVLYHCLDVGCVLKSIWWRLDPTFRKSIAKAVSLSEEDFCSWLCFFGAGHDVGKATPSFQNKTKFIKEQKFEERWIYLRDKYSFSNVWADNNEEFYHQELSQIIIKNFLKDNLGIEDNFLQDFCLCVGAHHGTFSNIEKRISLKKRQFKRAAGLMDSDKASWKDQQSNVLEILASFFEVREIPCPKKPGKWNQWIYPCICGMISTADWIASSLPFDCFVESDFTTYQKDVIFHANSILDEIGFIHSIKSVVDWEPEIAFDGKTLHPSQRECLEAIKDVNGQFLAIIENPTGSGKTEVGYSLSHYAMKKNKHCGIYDAMPTCATSNAMFDRFSSFINRIIGDEQERSIQLAHSRSGMKYKDIKEKSAVLKDDESTFLFHKWFSSGKRRMLAPFGVGTVDQSLAAILQSRYFFMRLLGLANKVIIFDEVHAYDVYMSDLFCHLLRWLSFLGCSVVVLSATLPASKRKNIARSFYGRVDLNAIDADVLYPRITIVGRGKKPIIRSLTVLNEERKTFAIRKMSYDCQVLCYDLLNSIKNGGCISSIVTVVGRSQKIAKMLQQQADSDVEIILLHARTSSLWRAETEQIVLDKFGRAAWENGKRPKKAIVIATQVLEQSLDVDFDAIWTDMAPGDLILQRIGRCHRHDISFGSKLSRPSNFKNPQVTIMVDLNLIGGIPIYGENNVDASLIYDQYIMHRTYLWFIYSNRQIIRMPDDTSDIIDFIYENVYFNSLPECWQEEMKKTKDNRDESDRKKKLKAFYRKIAYPYVKKDGESILDPFLPGMMVDDDDLEACDGSVEMGDSSNIPLSMNYQHGAIARIIPPNVQIVCLQLKDDKTYLPTGEEVYLECFAKDMSLELIERISNSAISVVNRKVVDCLKGIGHHELWDKSSLLRHLYPVVMTEDFVTVISGKKLTLSQYYGLEIE